MGKQTSDSAQTGPGVTKLPTKVSPGTPGKADYCTAPVTGVAMPAPMAKDGRNGWNTKNA
jgi:hypothetical protein